MEGTADSVTRFECSLCLEKFTDPRILTCFHSFCLKCLETYISTLPNIGGPNASFNCPLCRKVNVLPPEGAQGLQKNFYLDEPDEKVKKKFPECPDHPEEDLRFYCHVCKDPVCRDCKVIKHEGHRTEMLKDVVANMKEKLEKTLNDTGIMINDNETQLLTNIETDIDCLETSLSVMKESSAQMKTDIEETLTMVTSLITPRLNDQYDNMVTVQKQSDQKLKTFVDLKTSLTKANDENDNQSLFKLFSELIEDGAEITRLRDSPLASMPGTSSATGMNLDLKRLSLFFFEFRDAVQDGLEQFKRNFETCKITQGNNDVDMRVDERDKTPEVNLHNVEGNVKVKKRVKTGSLFSKKSQNYRGQLNYCSPGYDNKGHSWKPGTVVFTRGDNFLRIDAEPDDPEKPDFIATLQPDTILDASIYLKEFRLHINTPSASWFHFKPDNPRDERALKCLMEEIKQFKMKAENAFSPRTPTSIQDKNKDPNTSGSGDEDIVTLSSNLIKTLKDLDKSLNKPGSSSESPSAHKRKGETPTISSEKKPCLSTDRSCVGKTGKCVVGDSTQRHRSAPSATITSQEQASCFSTDDELDDLIPTASAAPTFQGLATSLTGDRLEIYLGRRVSMDSTTSSSTTMGGQGSPNNSTGQEHSTVTNQSLNSNNVNMIEPIPSSSAGDQVQTTNTQVQPLLQESDIQNACIQHEDHIPQVNCLGFDDVNGTPVSDTEQQPDEPDPAKYLDDHFKKTRTTPCIYWLPLTEVQAEEREKKGGKNRIQDRLKNLAFTELTEDDPAKENRGSPPVRNFHKEKRRRGKKHRRRGTKQKDVRRHGDRDHQMNSQDELQTREDTGCRQIGQDSTLKKAEIAEVEVDGEDVTCNDLAI